MPIFSAANYYFNRMWNSDSIQCMLICMLRYITPPVSHVLFHYILSFRLAMLIWRILSYLVCYVGNIIIYIHRAHHLLFILLKTSLMVPDFTIFVDGSSCKSLFLSLFLFLDFFFQAGWKSRSTEIYCIKKRRQNEIKIERSTWTAVNRNCKIWDY